MVIENAYALEEIKLGRRGENQARKVVFDVLRKWREGYGEGVASLIVQRNGDAQPYPVTVTEDDGALVWLVSSVDTAVAGEGAAELRYTVGDTIVKSQIYKTRVRETLEDSGETPPPAYQSWVDEVLQAHRVPRERPAQPVRRARSARQDPLAPKERLARRVRKGRLANAGQRARPAIRATRVTPLPTPTSQRNNWKACVARRAFRGPRGKKVIPATLGPKVKRATRAIQVRPGLAARKASRESKARQVRRAKRAILARRDRRVQPATAFPASRSRAAHTPPAQATSIPSP